MFSKLAIVLSSVALLAVATPMPADSPDASCSTGPVQCCNTVQSASEPEASNLLGLLGIAVEGITGQVGITCSPITVIGVSGGSSCSSQAVCCQDNSNSLISFGCVPVTL